MRALTLLLSLALAPAMQAETSRWSEQQANTWYQQQPWLVGGNYMPATAINQLEMWQADTFDPGRIDKELKWAQKIGMNTMRVFLHDLVWQQDAPGFIQRINTFLTIADKHGIKPMFVLFDSCWDPFPQLGPQRAPKPGVHNSGWVQGPGAKALQDASQYPRLETYVKGVVGAFANDKRILAWDMWNEPDNSNKNSYGPVELPIKEKVAYVETLLPQVFAWARAANPSQPLTSGVWQGKWDSPDNLSMVDRIQLDNSDVISFHNYEQPESFEKAIQSLQRYNRPLLCTEYMARGNKSTFQGTMPVAKRYNVAAYNWGLVAGKTQTHLPWDSWQQPYTNGREPAIWFHEVFQTNGKPYKKEETKFIKNMTKDEPKKKAA